MPVAASHARQLTHVHQATTDHDCSMRSSCGHTIPSIVPLAHRPSGSARLRCHLHQAAYAVACAQHALPIFMLAPATTGGRLAGPTCKHVRSASVQCVSLVATSTRDPRARRRGGRGGKEGEEARRHASGSHGVVLVTSRVFRAVLVAKRPREHAIAAERKRHRGVALLPRLVAL
jgi:hypothetical protein